MTAESQAQIEAAKRLVAMITELRYTMAVLAREPILIDTGQYQPRYQNRTYQDMENQIARDLTQQTNFQAKVKLLAGEHTVQTIGGFAAGSRRPSRPPTVAEIQFMGFIYPALGEATAHYVGEMAR